MIKLNTTGKLDILEEITLQDLTKKARLIYNKTKVAEAIEQMANKINHDMNKKYPLLLCVVNGGIYVTGQLLAKINIPLELDYIHASRYNNEISGKNITWRATPSTVIDGRNIIVVDDVLDQGITLKEIENWCLSKGAKSVYHVVLFDKTGCRAASGIDQANCTGLQAPNEYLFGCGLDVKGYYRNLPELYYAPKNILQELEIYLP